MQFNEAIQNFTDKTGSLVSSFTIGEAVAALANIEAQIKEYDSALKSIRGGTNWEYDIQKDTRNSVKVLYREYVKYTSMKEFLLKQVVHQETPTGKDRDWVTHYSRGIGL